MRFIHAVFALFVFAPLAVIANEISLRQLLSHMSANHPDIKIPEYSPQQSKLRGQAFLGSQDWRLSAHSSYSKDSFDDDADISYTSARESKRATLSLDKYLWNIGADVGLHYSTRGSEYENMSTVGERYYSSLNFHISVPLLRNFLGIQTRRAYEQIVYRIDISELRANERKEFVFTSAAHSYLNWVIAHEKVIQANNNLHNVRLVHAAITKSQDIARNQKRADWMLLAAKKDLSLAQATKIGVITRLKEYIQFAISPEDQPLFDLYSTEKFADTRPFVALGSLRLMRTLDIINKSIELDIQTSENATLANLNFDISGSLYGDGEDYDTSHDKDGTFYSVGLALRYPIGNRRAKANLDSARLNKMRNHDRSLQQELWLRSSVTSNYNTLKTLSEALALAQRQIAASNSVISNDLSAFKTGRIDIAILVDTMQTADEQNKQRIDDAARFQHLLINYWSAIDTLWNGQDLGKMI